MEMAAHLDDKVIGLQFKVIPVETVNEEMVAKRFHFGQNPDLTKTGGRLIPLIAVDQDEGIMFFGLLDIFDGILINNF